jgi:ProP effector
MPPKKVTNTPTPVVIVRKKAAKGTGTSTPVQPAPQRAVPPSKPAPPVTPPSQPVVQPVPSVTAQSSPAVPQPSLAAPAVGDSGPSKKEQQKQARRELLEVLRARWPQAFPRDWRQVRPLAIGIHRDLAAALPGHSHRQIGAAFNLFRFLTGPAYFRALIKGGPRYDLDGNPRGEVTAEEQEQAQRDLAAYQERHKLWMQAKRRGHESVQPAETS